jgi:hypothetical protein
MRLLAEIKEQDLIEHVLHTHGFMPSMSGTSDAGVYPITVKPSSGM